MGRLNPRGENKIQGKNGDKRKGENRKSHREEEDIGTQTEAARQSRAALHVTERKEESSTECFNDWGRRGYDDSIPGEITKTTPSGGKTT